MSALFARHEPTSNRIGFDPLPKKSLELLSGVKGR